MLVESPTTPAACGFYILDSSGVIRAFSSYALEVDGKEMIGKEFAASVASADEVERLAGRLADFVSGRHQDSYMSVHLGSRQGRRTRSLHVHLIRSTMATELLATVNFVGHSDLPMTAQTRPNAIRGTLKDAAGLQVLVTNDDFWRGMDQMLHSASDHQYRESFTSLGMEWGLAHTVRVEGFVQRQNSVTLREIELQIALEYLSGSLAVIGLGRFEVNLDHRRQGLVIIDHQYSPFPSLISGREGRCCHILAGFHAGVFSYLSGRRLSARELTCNHSDEFCRFVLGKEDRLEHLFDDQDADLLAELGRGLGESS